MAEKPLFRRGPLLGFRLGLLLLTSLGLMIVDHRREQLEDVRGALSLVVYPLQYVVNLPQELVRVARKALVTQTSLIAENRHLRRQNLMLRTRSQRFAALEAENMRLRELLESSLEVSERVLVADVIALELVPPSRTVVLDKGSQQGVYQGQPIIDGDGIMGQIIHVNPISSTALLITDISHALPVQINRSGVRAIASGSGSVDGLELAHVPLNADVKRGDLIVSSGLDGRFPAGYPVGVVTEISVDPGEPFAKVMAVASAKVEQAREVLLLWPDRRQNPDHPSSRESIAFR
ncbi:MAG: rod shape-determining protein MreC [Gammaproteobacteria bacterium]